MQLTHEIDYNEIVKFLLFVSESSDKIALEYFRSSSLVPINKSDNSPVTIADTEIEKHIRAKISESYPKHDIIGEEFDDLDQKSDYTWFIDPIDGTSSFISGKPTFTTLIALAYKNRPILSLISQPYLKERFYTNGINSFFNDKIIQASKVSKLDESVLSTTSLAFFDDKQLSKFNKVAKATKYQKHGGYFTGGDAYQYAMLASGHIDLVIEANLKPHDYMSLVPIIKNAGGMITDWNGDEVNANSNGTILASANTKLHQSALKLLN
ncbi:inositol monophosphatase family protein [Rickettsiales bacterium]|nr:inositol monophosphatase family protein [Rickettsiales bacterium]